MIFPFIMYQLWLFVEPGLKRKEKRFLRPFLLWSWFFFILGGCFAYFVMLQVAVPLLAQFGEGITVNAWSLSNYVGFVLRMVLVFGIVFELPVIVALLSMLGLVTPQFLRKNRSYAILIIAIASALLTPPDPFTMLLLMFPLLALYELSVFVSVFFQPKDTDPEEEVVESTEVTESD
jgi:sec-independent protein translocase protein TatC